SGHCVVGEERAWGMGCRSSSGKTRAQQHSGQDNKAASGCLRLRPISINGESYGPDACGESYGPDACEVDSPPAARRRAGKGRAEAPVGLAPDWRKLAEDLPRLSKRATATHARTHARTRRR